MKSSRKPVDVIGLVHPIGVGGVMNQNERRWTLSFSVQPWREVGGEIDDRELTIRQKGLTEKQLEKTAKTIAPDSLVRVRVRFPVRQFDPPSAELVKYLRKERSDAEMIKRAKALKKPVVVKDRYFGKFKFDRAMNWYVTEFEWNGDKIELCLPREECKDEVAFFRLAEGLCKQQKKWDREIREYATKELLKRRNKDWLEEGEEPISPEEFKKRIKLEAITLDPDGTFEFSFADDDIFWGHIIMVEGTLKKGPKYASIEG